MCMAPTHAWSGVTLALGYTALGLPLAPTAWPSIAAFCVAMAGCALLPDLDHPSSLASGSWGILTRLVSRLVVLVFGPHRHGAHSLLTALAAGLGAAGLAALGGWWVVVPVFLAASLAGNSLFHLRGLRNEAFGLAVALAVYGGQVGTAWLPIAVAGGCLAHIGGDRLTPQGMALYWPVSRRMVPGLGLFTTDTRGEALFSAALMGANLALLVTLAGAWADLLFLTQKATGYA